MKRYSDEKKKQSLNGKSVLVIGGTGTLGTVLVNRLLTRHSPKRVVVMSRDESKQHQMRQECPDPRLEYRIGDIADYQSVVGAVRGIDVIINTSALKQIPVAEQFPGEAMKTNTVGVANLIRCIQELQVPIETVIGISTDKACLPMSAYGMTKALMERLLIAANKECPKTRFVIMRSGNLLASRGSVIPLWKKSIENGGEVAVTDKRMARLFLTVEQMADAVLAVYQSAEPGEIWVPKMPSCRMLDIAKIMIGNRQNKIKYIGIRLGERLHEPIISKEELVHTYETDGYYVIHPLLLKPFTKKAVGNLWLLEYSSENVTLTGDGIRVLLEKEGLMPE